MKIAISQPRYLPALNYLQRIHVSDIFVILDNVQHQRRAFEHRNRVKSINGNSIWCSIPLVKKSSRPKIYELKVQDLTWIDKHKSLITSYYNKAEYFDKDILEKIYENVNEFNFVDIIESITANLCNLLEINYNFINASELNLNSSNDQLLYDISKKLGASEYISGSNGRDYIDNNLFNDIKLTYHDYTFPVYNQLHGQFIPWMSIVDQLFNIGIEETKKYIYMKTDLKDS